MPVWRDFLIVIATVTTATTAGARRVEMPPASETAVLAGAIACVGTATDPQGTERRLAGWEPAPDGSFKTDGRALIRDNVLIAVTPGARGACVVFAREQPDFSAKRLLADLERRLGAKLRSDAPPVLMLPNGELMKLGTGAKAGGPTYIQLALANANGK